MTDTDHRNVAAHVLATARKVVTTERGNQHGGAEDSFQMIGQLWQTYLNNTRGNSGRAFAVDDGIKITAYDVAQMMTLLKVARAVHGDPTNEDNYVDASGYQSLAAAIAGVKAPGPTPAYQEPAVLTKQRIATQHPDAALGNSYANSVPQPKGHTTHEPEDPMDLTSLEALTNALTRKE